MSYHHSEQGRGGYPVLSTPDDPKGSVTPGPGDNSPASVEMSSMADPKLVAVVKGHPGRKVQEFNNSDVDGFERINMQDMKKDEAEEDDELSDFEMEKNDLDDKERAWDEANILERAILFLQIGLSAIYKFLKKITKGYFLTLLFLVLFIVYFIVAMNYEFGDEGSHRLLGCTVAGICIWAYPHAKRLVKKMVKRCYGSDTLSQKHAEMWRRTKKVIRCVMYFVMTAIMVYMCVDEGIDKPKNLRSLPGIVIFLLLAFLCSTRPSKIQWHTIFWSMALQFICAVYVLKWKFGKNSIIWIQDRFTEFFDNGNEGSILAFGETYADHLMVFKAVPLVLFANATFTILYYLGAMQFIIRFIGKILRFFLTVTPIEAMSVASSIFVEGLAATMMMRPFLPKLTKSQLFTVVTGTMSSLGAGYLAILAAIGVSLEYLIPAMLISAPATFAICKLMVPEVRAIDDEDSEEAEDIGAEERTKYSNIFDAAQTGALTMLPVVANVIVLAYTFFSGVAWINHTLGWFGDRVGIDGLSIELISSYVLYPVALAMGIEPEDCRRVGMLLGYRIGIYNVVAFMKLTEMRINRGLHAKYMLATNFTGTITEHRDDITLDGWALTLNMGYISERSEAIVTYSLCGFSSFLSAAMFMGIVYTLVPKRKKWISSSALPAIFAGNLANCITGCFASLFY